MAPPVFVLHGLMMKSLAMEPLAIRLRRAGFAPQRWSYDSTRLDVPAVCAGLAEAIGRTGSTATPVHLVGHSLGGVLAVETLRRYPDLPVSRIVGLGSPLRGACVAQVAATHRIFRHFVGQSAGLLGMGTCVDDLPEGIQVGVVAGNQSVGLGRLVRRLEGPNDGTVRVWETKPDGLSDHCVVASTHTGLPFSLHVAALAVCFLREGRFSPAGQAGV